MSGSAYLIAGGVVLTAGHVIKDAGLARGAAVEVLPFGGESWLSATVVWLDAEDAADRVDAALLRLAGAGAWTQPLDVLQWGRPPPNEPVLVAAIGYPWAQKRPDSSRGTEHMVGFVTPPADPGSGLMAVNVLTSAPRERGGGSSWAGMSGAGLAADTATLVGLVVVDPGRFGPDRLLAVPVATLLTRPGFTEQLPALPEMVDVGADWRLSYGPAPEQSLRLRAPYRVLPRGFNLHADPFRLLDPQHKIVHVPGRERLVNDLVGWATETRTPLAIKTISGGGGAGKTRVAAEACLAVAAKGWDAGFADFAAPGGRIRAGLTRPTLIVIDDADVEFRRAGELVRQTVYSAAPVRLLLVSRDRSAWWTAFHRESEGNANGYDHGDLLLDEHLLDPASRAGLYREAHRRFRELIGTAPADPPPADLSADDFAMPLLIQITALVAALADIPAVADQGATDGLAAQADHGGETVRERVLRAAVAREANRWVRNLAAGLPSVTDRLVRRCVTTATLATPHTDEDAYQLEHAAVALLRAVPDLANDHNDDRLITLAGWLHTLHRGPSYWNPLRPDPLCDQLLADLDILPHLSVRLAEVAQRNGDLSTGARLLTELTRAASASGGAARVALARILAARPDPPVKRVTS
jgi:hypothetical protein